jgi:hypothetical protein
VEHWSDCAVHNGPGKCDCGGLDLARYGAELLSVAYIPLTRRFGRFVDLGGRSGFVEAEPPRGCPP